MDLSILAKKIKTYRNKNNLTQQELADKLKISRTTLSYYENASVEPNIYILINLAIELNCSLDDLIGFDIKSYYPPKNKNLSLETVLKNNLKDFQILKKQINEIHQKICTEDKCDTEISKEITPSIEDLRNEKLIDLKERYENKDYDNVTFIKQYGNVAAGLPSFACEEVEKLLYLPRKYFSSSFDYFALTVNGDSMNKLYEDGEVIIVKKTGLVSDGDIIIACISGEATCKEYYFNEDENKHELIPHSTNPKHKPQFYSDDEIMILGTIEYRLNDILDKEIDY